MNKFLVKSILTLLLLSGVSIAQSSGFALGIIAGEPTGISAKYWTTTTTAFDFGLGYSFERNSRMHLHADYLFHARNIFNTTENVSLHYGPGGRIFCIAEFLYFPKTASTIYFYFFCLIK